MITNCIHCYLSIPSELISNTDFKKIVFCIFVQFKVFILVTRPYLCGLVQ